ncbi:MAG: hypothetical protein AAGK22_29080 [Acidobacteriota bacterium]
MKRVLAVCCFLAGASLLVVAAGLSAQEVKAPGRAVVIDSDSGDGVPLVAARTAELHVRVHKGGTPIRGLNGARFQVTMGDLELEVERFRELGTSSEASEGVDSAVGRSVLVVLDLVWTPPPLIQQAVAALRQELGALNPKDRVALVALGESSRLLHPFTTDRHVVRAGLDLVDAVASRDVTSIRSAFEALDEKVKDDRSLPASESLGLEAAWIVSRGGAPFAPVLPEQLVSPRPDKAEALAALDALLPRGSTAIGRGSINSLLQAFLLLSDVPGPKVALLFSRGLRQKRAPEADPRPPNLSRRPQAYEILGPFLSMHGWNVQAFTLGGGGSRRASAFDMSSSPVDRRPEVPQARTTRLNDWGVETLRRVAQETNGDHYARPGRIAKSLRASLDSTSHSYELLVRAPSPASTFENSEDIDVRVTGVPRKSEVATYLSKDWSHPRQVQTRFAVDSARRQLLAGVGPQQLPAGSANVEVQSGATDTVSAAGGLVAVHLDRSALLSVLDARRTPTLSFQGLALPLDTTYGLHPRFDDFFELPISAQPGAGDEGIVTTELKVSCHGALLRFRLALEAGSKGVVLEARVKPTCAGQLNSPETPSTRESAMVPVRVQLQLANG